MREGWEVMHPRDQRTPDTLDVARFFEMTKAEFMDQYGRELGWTDEIYDRVRRDLEGPAALRENREAQGRTSDNPATVPMVVHLASMHGVDIGMTRSGLIVPTANDSIIRIR